jgi:hypothetical protein
MTAPDGRTDPIELERYFDAIRRQRKLVLTAVVAAAIITLIMFLLQPRQYRATAAVVVPVPAEVGSRIAAVGQSVSDFEGALRSGVVAQRTSRVTGEPSVRILSALDTQQLFGGSLVEVAYTTSDPEIAEDVAELASRQALVVLLTAQLAPFEEARQSAQETAQNFQRDYEEFLERTGMVNPDQYFEKQQNRLIRLTDEIGLAEAQGDEELAERLTEQLENKQAAITPLRVEWTTLEEGRTRAALILSEVESAYSTANASLEAAREGRSVDVSDATAIPRAAQLLRQLLVVVVLSTALAIGLIVLLELVSMPRRPVRGAVSAAADRPGEQGDGAISAVQEQRNAAKRSKAARRRRRAQGRPAKLG